MDTVGRGGRDRGEALTARRRRPVLRAVSRAERRVDSPALRRARRSATGDPTRSRLLLAGIDGVERGDSRLFVGLPGVHSSNRSGMDPWRGVMPPAPDPRGARNAAEMLAVYAIEQVRDPVRRVAERARRRRRRCALRRRRRGRDGPDGCDG